MANKLGPYISSLMTVIMDREADQFVRDLAIEELERLRVDINSFMNKHYKDESDEIEQTEKKLLLEEEKPEK